MVGDDVRRERRRERRIDDGMVSKLLIFDGCGDLSSGHEGSRRQISLNWKCFEIAGVEDISRS